jgi:hypothetical protein
MNGAPSVPPPHRNDQETTMDERLKVVRRDAYSAGWCQGCADKQADVYEITAGTWVTRFCWHCLKRIVETADELRR